MGDAGRITQWFARGATLETAERNGNWASTKPWPRIKAGGLGQHCGDLMQIPGNPAEHMAERRSALEAIVAEPSKRAAKHKPIPHAKEIRAWVRGLRKTKRRCWGVEVRPARASDSDASANASRRPVRSGKR